jgi:translation elongation factor EF-1beta|tara:strand:- start:804 stop:1139 length:336 start_codon:yes stop_codon:yes gene_type:complete
MDFNDIHKLAEIQYLTGRLDELYKGYVPNYNSTDNRIMDNRISKYEDKLMNLDPIAFHLYKVQHKNVTMAKKKSKQRIGNLLNDVKNLLVDEGVNKHQKMVDRIEEQLNTY